MPSLSHSSVSDCQSLHHVAELLKLDLSVMILVDFFNELTQDVVLVLYSEGALNLIWRNRAAAVFVEEAEGRL